MQRLPGNTPLTRFERLLISLWFPAVLTMGIFVVIRSDFLEQRMTDFGCYARAAWAVRTGGDIYNVTDDRGWHYAYPPAFAALMVPFADAPNGEARELMLPFAVSVGIWYCCSIVFLIVGVHWIARTMERTTMDLGIRSTRIFSRRWWYARSLPITFCLIPIGTALSRGQVNLLLIMLVGGLFAAAVTGRRFQAGLWLAAAICLKFIPGFLLLYPLWRRDGRMLGGAAVGLLVGTLVVPSIVWGPSGAIQVHRRMLESVLLPSVSKNADSARDTELMNITATDNQSIQAVVHYVMHPDAKTRPPQAGSVAKWAHVLVTFGLTGLLLAAAGTRPRDPVRELIFLGGLLMIMTIASPVSHTHYFCFALPLVMGILAQGNLHRAKSVFPDRRVFLAVLTACILFSLATIPLWKSRREDGMPLIGSLILIGVGTAFLIATRESAAKRSAETDPDLPPIVAATRAA